MITGAEVVSLVIRAVPCERIALADRYVRLNLLEAVVDGYIEEVDLVIQGLFVIKEYGVGYQTRGLVPLTRYVPLNAIATCEM